MGGQLVLLEDVQRAYLFDRIIAIEPVVRQRGTVQLRLVTVPGGLAMPDVEPAVFLFNDQILGTCYGHMCGYTEDGGAERVEVWIPRLTPVAPELAQFIPPPGQVTVLCAGVARQFPFHVPVA
jgi:hypothetical protein